jgi:hypothetical protein
MSAPLHPAAALATAAARYCSWMERLSAPDTNGSDRTIALREAREMRLRLAEVYSRALELDRSEIDSANLADEPGPREWSRADLPNATARLRALPFSYYRDVSDGYLLDEDGTAPIGDLCDDALDIWIHLRGPLELWHAGCHDTAAWFWLVTFEVELGHHIVHALHALHDFVTDAGR